MPSSTHRREDTCTSAVLGWCRVRFCASPLRCLGVGVGRGRRSGRCLGLGVLSLSQLLHLLSEGYLHTVKVALEVIAG